VNSIQKIVLAIIVITILFFSDFFIEKFNEWYFGYKYNDKRIAFNIPEIPPNWSSKQTSKKFIFWYPEGENEKIYLGKEIKYNSFSIISEKDSYQKIGDVAREKISITRFYKLNKTPIVSYQIFNDSVLTSEIQLNLEESLKLIREWESSEKK